MSVQNVISQFARTVGVEMSGGVMSVVNAGMIY